ncbi:MAG: GTP 3',8-cyclase MoaA, partial [Candidatus Omnitrophica bacterium]|nr:GTP 3',8-cyclase MoaA [Candidatus Omnitrophota bacterium]
MKDRFGRGIDYLRLSVVDRCNLSCLYCMPYGGAGGDPGENLLSYEEITALAALFAGMGIRKIRITGGEPLVRKQVWKLVAMLREIPGIEELALSTNGVFLAEQAGELKKAGVQRLNISLDTLRSKRFRQIARVDRLEEVLRGIDAALESGFRPVKINTVLMKGVNDDEILDLVRFAVKRGLEIRFIELMPTNQDVALEWGASFFSAEEAKAVVETEYRLLEADAYFSSPAKVYSVAGTDARIGFISPLSCFFCSRCNRLRLKSNGMLKTCLHGKED